mmetsp:Transcript_12629/g.36742  ORF Transcript_12629/g.36742 Transcript_12629/m.36742 type:complete len:328 (+) Transcript_12629:211-1194(+)
MDIAACDDMRALQGIVDGCGRNGIEESYSSGIVNVGSMCIDDDTGVSIGTADGGIVAGSIVRINDDDGKNMCRRCGTMASNTVSRCVGGIDGTARSRDYETMNAFMGTAVVGDCVLCNMCALNIVKDEARYECIGAIAIMVVGQSVGISTRAARSGDLENDWMCAMSNYRAADAVVMDRWHIAAVAHIAGRNLLKLQMLNIDSGSRYGIVNACAAVVGGKMDGRVMTVNIRKMGASHGTMSAAVVVVAVDVAGSATEIANVSNWMGCQCSMVISDTAVVDDAVSRSTRMGDNWNVLAMQSSRCRIVTQGCHTGRGGVGMGAGDTING